MPSDRPANGLLREALCLMTATELEWAGDARVGAPAERPDRNFSRTGS